MPSVSLTHPAAGDPFPTRYGPWAVVVGASEGLGAAFAEALARRGLNLVLVARRVAVLEALAEGLGTRHGVSVVVCTVDAADADAADRIVAAAAGLDVGLVIMNAAAAPVGAFTDAAVGDVVRAIDVNCRTPSAVLSALLPAMVARQRGGVVLMSSMAGMQGSPRLATYSATKAFLIAFGEALWAELKPHDVDVVVCIAGAIRTPGYLQSQGKKAAEAPGTLDADVVAERALRSLGAGPRVIPGALNQFAALLMGRLLPRGMAIRLMGHNTKDLQ